MGVLDPGYQVKAAFASSSLESTNNGNYDVVCNNDKYFQFL